MIDVSKIVKSGRYRRSEVAALLDCSVGTVSNMVRDGRLRAHYASASPKSLYFRGDDILRYLGKGV